MLLLNLLEFITPTGKGNVIKSVEKDMSLLDKISITDLINKFAQVIVDFAFKIVIAIIVFYVGKFIINKLYKITKAIMVRRKVELSLATFILSLLKITLLFLLIVIVISILGIETSSFIAIFASAGVAVGMALSGTLQNFAGGVLILLIKPYKVGDYIEVQGYSGTVKEIQIFYTIINTLDNKAIIMPNGSLSTGTINNFSKESYRRVDWIVSISYGDSIDNARTTICNILNEDSRILKSEPTDANNDISSINETAANNDNETDDNNERKGLLSRIFKKNINVQLSHPSIPEVQFYHENVITKPIVAVTELADSSVNLKIMAWTKSENYWSVYYDMNEIFYEELPKYGLSFPFPQMDVHWIRNK